MADLGALLTALLSPVAGERVPAETLLASVSAASFFHGQLIGWIKENPVASAPRCVLAAVIVKNGVRRNWSAWPPADRRGLQPLLLGLALDTRTSAAVAVHARTAVAGYARAEWPDGTPDLFPAILERLGLALSRPLDGDGLAVLTTALSLANAVVKELSSKRLMADKQRLSTFAAELIAGPVLVSALRLTGDAAGEVIAAASRGPVPEDLRVLEEGRCEALCNAHRKCTKLLARLVVACSGHELLSSEAGGRLATALAAFTQRAHDGLTYLLSRRIVTNVGGMQVGSTSSWTQMQVLLDAEGAHPALTAVSRAVSRSSWAALEMFKVHGLSYAGTGALSSLVLWSAGHITSGEPCLRRVVIDGLVLMSVLVDLAQRIARGEGIDTLEAGVGPDNGSATPWSPRLAVHSPDGRWAAAGIAAVQDLSSRVFGPSVVDSWLASLITNCLPLTQAELMEDWGVDSEEAMQAASLLGQGDHPRNAAEALLCALLSAAPAVASDRVGKVLSHASGRESSLMLAITAGAPPDRAYVRHVLVQVESAWLACGLAAADAMELTPPLVNTASWEAWCTARLLPLAHALGLDLTSALAGFPAIGDAVTSAFSGHLPPRGVLMQADPPAAVPALRRLLWLLSTYRSACPPSRGGEPPNPLRVVFLRLFVGAMALAGVGAELGHPLLAAVRLAGAEAATAIVDDTPYANALLSSPAVVIAVAGGVYAALPAVSQMESKLQLLALLHGTLKRVVPSIKVACVERLLSPLSSIWAAVEDGTEGGFIRRSILEIVTLCVEAFHVQSSGPRSQTDGVRVLLEGLAPLVVHATGPTQPDFVYLAADGLHLLSSVLEASPLGAVSGPLCTLYAVLPGVVGADSDLEYASSILRIVTDFALRAPSVAAAYPAVLPTVLRSMLGRVPSRLVPVLSSTVHTALAQFGAPAACATLAGHGVAGLLVATISLSLTLRRNEEATDGSIRRALLQKLSVAGGSEREGPWGAAAAPSVKPSATSSRPHDDSIRVATDADGLHLSAGMIACLLLHDPSAFVQSLGEWGVSFPGGMLRCGAFVEVSPLGHLLSAAASVPVGSSPAARLEELFAAVGAPAGIARPLLALRLLVLALDSLLACVEDCGTGTRAGAADAPSTVCPSGPPAMGNKLLCLAGMRAAQAGLQLRSQLIAALAPGVSAASPPVLQALLALLRASGADAGAAESLHPAACGRLDALASLYGEVTAALVKSSTAALGSYYGRSPLRVPLSLSLSRGIAAENEEDDSIRTDAAPTEPEELAGARYAAHLRHPEVTGDLAGTLADLQAALAASA